MKKNTFITLVCLISVYWFSVTAYGQQVFSDNAEQVNEEPSNLVKFKTQDEMLLAGYYYAGLPNNPGVILLHDCAHTGANFQPLAKAIADIGLHALAVDLRGYGYSANVLYSHDIIKKQSRDINTYQSEVTRITSFWESDILASFNFMLSRIGNEQPISVVSAGCTTPQAVLLAEKIRVHSFVMITPIFNHMEKEKYKNLIDLPVYFVSSNHHANSLQIAKELYEWNGDQLSTMQIFKGNRFGNTLLNRNNHVIDNIALWLQKTLQ